MISSHTKAHVRRCSEFTLEAHYWHCSESELFVSEGRCRPDDRLAAVQVQIDTPESRPSQCCYKMRQHRHCCLPSLREFSDAGPSSLAIELRLWFEFEEEFDLDEVKRILTAAPGVVVVDGFPNQQYPMPMNAH